MRRLTFHCRAGEQRHKCRCSWIGWRCFGLPGCKFVQTTFDHREEISNPDLSPQKLLQAKNMSQTGHDAGKWDGVTSFENWNRSESEILFEACPRGSRMQKAKPTVLDHLWVRTRSIRSQHKTLRKKCWFYPVLFESRARRPASRTFPCRVTCSQERSFGSNNDRCMQERVQRREEDKTGMNQQNMCSKVWRKSMKVRQCVN